MIIFNVLVNDTEKAKSIASYTLNQKYALHIHIDNNNDLCPNDSNALNIRLYFITKALLYNEIELAIKQHFYSDNMIMYATPISHINQEFGDQLRNNLKSISNEILT